MAVDLFTPIVSSEAFHPNFKAALLDASRGERRVLEEWAKTFEDRDGKFIEEFQISFNPSYWELYLHAAFRELNCTTDWQHERPDFLLTKGSARFVVEATSANAAMGKPKEWERDISPEALANLQFDIPEINREAMIRLSNGIVTKHRKYRDSYRKLGHVAGKPYLVAVGPFEQPHFYLQHDRPIRALLYDDYVDEEAAIRSPELFPNGPPNVSLGSIEKDNGAEIELGFFNSNVMEEISAVIFSSTATWGKLTALSTPIEKSSVFNCLRHDEHGVPKQYTGVKHGEYNESLLDGLQVYHNPFAKYPISPDVFRADGVVQMFFDQQSERFIHEGIPNSLVWRQTFGFVSSEGREGLLRA